MYGMTPVGVFFIAFFRLKINEHALCQQPQNETRNQKGIHLQAAG
jgi:hypothetical protein